MKERPILFSGGMVRAILSGAKTQTRRIAKKDRHLGPASEWAHRPDVSAWCPYGAPGDRLWVRETFALFTDEDERPTRPVYRADGGDYSDCETPDGDPFRWTPSIHMPRAFSRITLEITDVRVERLQAITREDAIAEGARHYDFGYHDGYPNWRRNGWSMREVTSYDQVNGTATTAFANEWNCIADGENWSLKDGPTAWHRNPWVWAISFRRVTP